jgi:GTP-binding protein EngB required for normal cell division
MKAKHFNINIAIIGHVSVGKSTLLNAILGEKFSQVSKKRTTAGINHFHVSPIAKSTDNIKKNKIDSTHQQTNDHLTYDSLDEEDTKIHTETLTEITQDNIKLREQNIIQDKHFHIELDEILFEMRPDTSLTIVDVPGLNEAGTRDMYTSYVKESWCTYSCVIVVMDVCQGVNTEEQVQLLKFVKSNVTSIKDIPVIVLCNKVDDTSDDELMELVSEVQSEVDKIFETRIKRSKVLEKVLDGEKSKLPFNAYPASSPAFLPLSAENAFLYRRVSSLPLDEFVAKVDQGTIDKIGNREIGYMKWRRMSKSKRYETIHEIVSDPQEYEERLTISNYDKLMKLLKYFVGGEDNQKYLIGKQIEVDLKSLTCKKGFANHLSDVYDCCILIGKRDVQFVHDTFWLLLEECKSNAISALKKGVEGMKDMIVPMQELINYHEGLLRKAYVSRRDDEGVNMEDGKYGGSLVIKTMKDLIKEYINVVISKAPSAVKYYTYQSPYVKCACGYWCNILLGTSTYDGMHPDADKYADCWEWKPCNQYWINIHTRAIRAGTSDKNPAYPSNYVLSWYHMSFRDWSDIVNSILLMRYNRYFCEHFGQVISDLVWNVRHDPVYAQLKVKCSNCNRDLNTNSKFTKMRNTCMIPDHISDSKHWGHLIWMFCCFLDSFKKNSSRK